MRHNYIRFIYCFNNLMVVLLSDFGVINICSFQTRQWVLECIRNIYKFITYSMFIDQL